MGELNFAIGQLGSASTAPFEGADGEPREWLAAYTAPKSERSVVRHLDVHGIESYLPTFEAIHVWKNKQKKKIVRPLFPSYVFVHVRRAERRFLFRAPGILRLVGSAQGPLPIPPEEIEVLRSEPCKDRLEPFREPLVGERVRIRCGPMAGVCGILVRKKNFLRLVVSISLINQHAALEVSAEDVEAIDREQTGDSNRVC